MKPLNRVINPISIIAIFATFSEASATAVLPYLDEDNREIYIWFLIAFPSALVVMFFLTLNFNNKVLYHPLNRPYENGTLTPAPRKDTLHELDHDAVEADSSCRKQPRTTEPGSKAK